MLSFDVTVRSGRRSPCLVRVGAGVLRSLPRDLRARLADRTLVVVSDATVARLHGRPLAERLRSAGFETALVTFPPGESSKSRDTKAEIEDRLFALRVGRDSAILAVGGGVTTDLGGFVAATWNRGVPLVHVPTTLLAMVDAALGGKTGVDLPGGKNLIGAYHQPEAVYADVATLLTLPDRHFAAGFAEAVKTAAIADVALFRWLETSSTGLRERSTRLLATAVASCLRIKGRIVARDERERGRRAILNFGHTVAHAIEAASEYRIPHGHAVSIGLVVESRLAVSALGFPSSHAARIETLLRAFGLPTALPASIDPVRVVEATRRDKKSRGGEVRCALPRSLGRMLAGNEVTLPIEPRRLRRALSDRTTFGKRASH
jgi:3-dehydroquinate synthase